MVIVPAASIMVEHVGTERSHSYHNMVTGTFFAFHIAIDNQRYNSTVSITGTEMIVIGPYVLFI
jgi:hypothetical protein